MSITKLFEIGLSGWIVFIFTILLGSGLFVTKQIIRRKSRQFNIKAGGDVAGGNIIKCKNSVNGCSSKIVTNTYQKNIDSNGDIAGGDIIKEVNNDHSKKN